MATTNDITGDRIVTKQSNDAFSEGWDLIWGNKKKKEGTNEEQGMEQRTETADGDKPVSAA